MRVLRRVLIAIAAGYVVLACWGLFRRIWQVLRVDVQTSATLAPGSIVSIDVVTSGEVQNRILLELVQDSQTETLLEFQARLSANNTLDPRLFRYTPSVTITPSISRDSTRARLRFDSPASAGPNSSACLRRARARWRSNSEMPAGATSLVVSG